MTVSSIVWYFAAAGLLLVGVLMLVVAWMISQDSPASTPTGPNVFEGTVTTSPQVAGTDIVLAWTQLGPRQRSSHTQSWVMDTLFDGTVGSSTLQIQTSEGVETLTIGDPLQHLRVFEIEETTLPSFEGHPLESLLPNWREHMTPYGFVVRILAVRSGDQVLVIRGPDGQIDQLWKGGRAALEARDAQIAASSHKISRVLYGFGVFLLLVASGCSFAGWRLGFTL